MTELLTKELRTTRVLHRGLYLGLIPALVFVALPHSSYSQIGSSAAAGAVPDGLSASDWAGICAAREAAQHVVVPDDLGGHRAWNPGQGWTARFDGRGFEAAPAGADWTWGLELVQWGRKGHERPIFGSASAEADGQRLAYVWSGALTEWWINDGRGLEHGYTVQSRPEGDGALAFTLAVRGGLCAEPQDDGLGVRFVDASGGAALTYAGLTAWDADGRELPAGVVANGDALRLVVDDRGARYPLTVDPMAQQAYLKASNTGAMDFFGYSVAVSGDTVVVGAYFEDSNATGVNGDQSNNGANNSGAAYVFVRDGTTWSQQAYLKASNAGTGDRFGAAVAISGDTIVVGASGEDSTATGVNGGQGNGASGSGAAYVFVRDGTTWSQQAYLKASNTGSEDLFGGSVSVSGDTIVVAASHEASAATGIDGNQSNDDASESGAAYVFIRHDNAWTQQAYLKASNTDAFDRFGESVSVSGDTIVAGAWREDSAETDVNGDQSNNSALDSGAAYVFVREGTTWIQQAYLKASNTDSEDYFGFSVSASGDTVVVGAYREASAATGINSFQSNNSAQGAGAAYVFVRDGTNWTQQAYLKASNTNAADNFAFSVSISGDTVVAGAPYEDSAATGVNGDQSNNGANWAGAAYVFVRDGTDWTQPGYLKASNAEAEDFFGNSVSVSGDTVVVGAWWEDSAATGVNGFQANNSAATSGAAYVFDLDFGMPSDLDGDGTVNGADLGILLAAWGTDETAPDLNGDGIVDGADLGELLASWTG